MGLGWRVRGGSVVSRPLSDDALDEIAAVLIEEADRLSREATPPREPVREKGAA